MREVTARPGDAGRTDRQPPERSARPETGALSAFDRRASTVQWDRGVASVWTAHRAANDAEPNRFFLLQLASSQSRATFPSAFTLSKVSSTPFSFAVVLIRSQTALLRMVSRSS